MTTKLYYILNLLIYFCTLFQGSDKETQEDIEEEEEDSQEEESQEAENYVENEVSNLNFELTSLNSDII